jgi:hypothetical protein
MKPQIAQNQRLNQPKNWPLGKLTLKLAQNQHRIRQKVGPKQEPKLAKKVTPK